MSVLASKGQLRASMLRWALLTIPACLLLGFLSGQLGSTDSAWFLQLVKPAIYPTPIVFPIVWMILYAMMGLALALICSAWGARGRGVAIGLFIVQFALNMAWTPVFFGAYQLTGGLLVLVALVLVLVPTIAAFWRIRRQAGLLLLPYLAWLLFAALLNYQFLQLNPDADGATPQEGVQRIEL